jgi:hypothetical protein
MVPQASSEAKKDAPPFKPVASTESLMYAQEYHFDHISELIESEAKSRYFDIASQGEILAELANINRYHDDREDYIQWCELMKSKSLEIAEAAKKKDDAAIKTLVKDINKDACSACHNKYQ